MWSIDLVVMTTMVLINAVFAAFEIALASAPITRLQILARQNRRGAAAALSMKQEMESSLAVIQLGVALVGAIAAATGAPGPSRRSPRPCGGWDCLPGLPSCSRWLSW